MKALSLFSGVGGFELGFGRAGITTGMQVEQDRWCQEVLQTRWPGSLLAPPGCQRGWREQVVVRAHFMPPRHSCVCGNIGIGWY